MPGRQSEQARQKKLKFEMGYVGCLEIGNLLLSHFGYAAIAASGYLFKLAIAATAASYLAFLSATLVGGLITYFPVMVLRKGLEYFKLHDDYTLIPPFFVHLGLSPAVGAWALNGALGWSLSLAPMLAIGGVGVALGMGCLVLIAYIEHWKEEANKPLDHTRSGVATIGTFGQSAANSESYGRATSTFGSSGETTMQGRGRSLSMNPNSVDD